MMRISSGKILPAARIAFAATLIVAANAPCAAQDASAAQLSAQIVQWGQANADAYAEAMAASRNPVGAVPVPPLIDPPCNLCGQRQNAVTNGAQLAQAWINQALQPEDRYLLTLANILKTAQQNEGYDINALTPAAQAVVNQFNATLIRAAMKRLGNHLVVGKAIPMAQQNLNEPRRAYAGILFLIAAARDGGVFIDSDNAMQQILDLARQWQQTVVNRADQDIEQGHRYNLCPVYLLLLRQLDTLSTEINSLSADELEKQISEWQKLLYFDIDLNLHVSGKSSHGIINADWDGKAKLKIVLDSLGSCYKPEIENSGNMEMSIQPYDFQWIEHDKDGEVQIQYQGPTSFNVKLDLIQLNLCDPQPVLQLPLAGLHAPIETFKGKGKSFQNMMFGAFMSAVVQANHTNRTDVNQMTGKSYSSAAADALTPLTGGSSGSNGSGESASNENDVLAPLIPSGSSNAFSAGSTSASSGNQDEALAPLVPSGASSSSSNGNSSYGNQNEALAPLTSSGFSGSSSGGGNGSSGSGGPDDTLAPLTSSDSSGNSSSGSADPYTQLNNLTDQIKAHMGDTAWAQSADGKATVAQYKQVVNQLRDSAMATAGMSDPSSSSDTLAPLVASSPSSQDAQLQNIRAQLDALKNTPGGLSSPQGQAAMAQLMQQANAKSQQAMTRAQAKLNAAGVVVPKEANMMSLAAAVMSVQLPWTNGQIEPVNQTLRAEKDGDKIELRISVRQSPQP
jgi:hypothetical protein